MQKYDHQKIEKKWQEYWAKKKIFKADVEAKKPKYYVLDMFPYPSGAGLHVGHVTNYTGTDIIARYKRQCGFNVLHPMGWDSFGLPAEQYAIRTGTHPAITTQKNIQTYRQQMDMLGFSYDWDREIKTSDPKYYKWTQWIFTKLYEKGLAYEANINVNFCPALGTVLANEEVEDGKSKEGGYPVEKRPLRQWVLKITQYAERLIADLDEINWPESVKKLQVNWIGKSEGAKITFKIKGNDKSVTVFTSRPDTLFGVTFLVVAPEHPLALEIATPEQKSKVEQYCKSAIEKSEVERSATDVEKNGVWTGAFAINPITGKEIPIWVADYVLIGYGTGAVMGVPANDMRDFAFASKYKMEVIPVVDPEGDVSDDEVEQILAGKMPWEGSGKMINSQVKELSINGLYIEKAKSAVIAFLEKNKRGEKAISYKLRDWLFSRQRYWGEPIPILHFADGTKRALEIDELPLLPPEVTDYKPTGEHESPLAKVKSWVEIVDPKTHKKAKRETNTMPQWAGSCWYYLRFCDPNNEKMAWDKAVEKYWMPVDLYVGGTEHAVLHLLYARFWHKVLFDCGLVSTNEPFKTYRYQGIITAPSYKRKGGGYVDPNEVVEENGKYFTKKGHEEIICQIEKMSKSKLNGVSPEEVVEEFGADALRLYAMFMGPFDREKVWNTDAVNGCKRFLNRFYDLAVSNKVTDDSSIEALKLGHRLVATVSKEIEALEFNTAIAHMMEFVNAFSALAFYSKEVLKMAVQVLYPFAPHISEELWQHLGEKNSLAYAPLPKVDPKYLVEDMATYVVQVNGKVRGKWELAKGKSEKELLALARETPQVSKYITGEIIKTVFVPDKLLSLVVKE